MPHQSRLKRETILSVNTESEMASKFRNCINLRRKFSSRVGDSNKLESIGIIGVPQNKGQSKEGVEEGPASLREAGLVDVLKNISGARIVRDYGNLSYSSIDVKTLENMKNWREVLGCNRTLLEKVQKILKENEQVLVLGGDHSIAVGSVAGHLAHDPNLALIWVDAHADINLNRTSSTGNIHGMPVSFLLEELQLVWRKQMEDCFKERIASNRLVYIGLRDIDPYESYLLRSLGITAYGMDAVDKYGIHKIMEMLFETIDPKGELNYHVSFDIDALDTREAPSTGTPVPGGLTLREGIYLMERLAETGRVTGVDLVEINPKIGTELEVRNTLLAALEILKAVFGHNRLGDMKEFQEFGVPAKLLSNAGISTSSTTTDNLTRNETPRKID